MTAGKTVIYAIAAALITGACNFAIFVFFWNRFTDTVLSDYVRSEIAGTILTVVLPLYLVLAFLVSFALISFGAHRRPAATDES